VEEQPTVTVCFLTREGVAHIFLPWIKGKVILSYLRDPALREYALPGKLLAQRLKLFDERRKKLKWRQSLNADDTIYVGR